MDILLVAILSDGQLVGHSISCKVVGRKVVGRKVGRHHHYGKCLVIT